MVESKYSPAGLTLSFLGDGKGKTTSSIGLCVRSLSYNWKVLVVQMLKTNCKAFELLETKFPDNLTLKQYGQRKITLPSNVVQEDFDLVKEAWDYIWNNYENYQMIIIDEALCSLNLELYNRTTLWTLIEQCELKKINLVLTGRVWSRSLLHKIVEKSSLCTECKPRKHYFVKNCTKCHREFEDYSFNYCPFCQSELKSRGAQFAVEL